MASVRIPPPLRTETGGEPVVAAEGGTVRDVLVDLVSRFPSLRARVLEDGEVARFVNDGTAVGRFAHDLHVGLRIQNRLEPLTHGFMVVRQQDAELAGGSVSHGGHDIVNRS